MKSKRLTVSVCVFAAGVTLWVLWVSNQNEVRAPEVLERHSVPAERSVASAQVSVTQDHPLSAESEKRESADLQIDIASPYGSRYPGNPVTLSDLRREFDTHYSRAEEGDPGSMLMIADLYENCSNIGRIQSVEQLQRMRQSLLISEDGLKGLTPLLPECRYINSHVPEAADLGEWITTLTRRAAEAGHVIAQLRVLLGENESMENYESLAHALEKSVRTDDYRAYYAAASFYGKYSVPSNYDDLEHSKWSYLACIHHNECDQTTMRGNLEIRYLPAEVSRIVEWANAWEERKMLLEPIGFLTEGWSLAAEECPPEALCRDAEGNWKFPPGYRE